MKLSKAEVQRRNEKALAFFKSNPDAPGTAFNTLLANENEKKMALVTVYKLRDQARAEIGWQAKGDVAAAPIAPEVANG